MAHVVVEWSANLEGQADIHGLVPIGAIIDPVRLD